jgi:uncharacterized iron-regulated membrane protein
VSQETRASDQRFWDGADAIARRLRLHLATLVLLATVVTGSSALVVKSITGTIRDDIRKNRDEVSRLRDEQHDLAAAMRERTQADSVRFEKTLDVVGLAVVAVVEPDGSPAQRRAIDELRRRRRITI